MTDDNESKYIFVTFESNYADEYDVSGALVMERIKLYEFFDRVIERRGDKPFEIYFGSNEWLTYNNYVDFIQDFKIESITESQYESFISIVGEAETGESHILGFSAWAQADDDY